MDLFIAAQLIGFIALCLEMWRFQCKSPRIFFYVEPILATLYFTQFYLLGADAYIVSALAIARGILGLILSQKNMRPVIILLFIPAYISIAIMTYSSFFHLLPILAISCSTAAFLIQENRKLVVRLFLLNTTIWFAYAIPVDAYVHAINSALIFGSLIIGIIRHENIKLPLSFLKPKMAT